MPTLTTRSGRNVTAPVCLVEEISAMASNYYGIGLTSSEQGYYDAMHEFGQGKIACMGAGLGGSMIDERFVEVTDGSNESEIANVGAGLGGGFEHTSELKVLTYKKAMASENSKRWKEAVKEEHRKMEYYKVFRTVLRTDLPVKAKILTSTWAMKKKSNRVFRARRINARGYEQIDGKHYDGHAISSPVTNDVTIRIVLVLMLMADWVGELLDVKGAFLHGDFEDGRNVYIEVPEGFQE
jgi:hypothetical protein